LIDLGIATGFGASGSHEIALRRKAFFASVLKLIRVIFAGSAKICFRFSEMYDSLRASRPDRRGVRVVTNVGRDAMDAGCII
jgi:hypothetical protein